MTRIREEDFLLQAPQCPCSVRKRFSRDHCCWWRSTPGCRIVGSHTRWELTTWADFQLCFHRLLMLTGCKSSHSGLLDVSRSNGGLRISGWIGQLSCLMIFSTSLSVAAFLRRAGSSMLDMSRGDNGQGILGTICLFWAKWGDGTSHAEREFFCVVIQRTFWHLRNGRFSTNLVTKRSSVSQHGIQKDIFENFH